MRLYLAGILGVLALIEVHTQKATSDGEAFSADIQLANANAPLEIPIAPDANEKPKGKGKQPRVKGEPVVGNRTKTPRAGGANKKGGKGSGRMRGRPRERLPPGNGTAPERRRRPKTTTEAPPPEAPPVVIGPDGQPAELQNVTGMVDTSGGIIRRKKGRKNSGKKTTTVAPPA